MTVIRIPLEIDASQAQDSLRIIRRDFATLEREAKARAKSIGRAFGGISEATKNMRVHSLANEKRGDFISAANAATPGNDFGSAAKKQDPFGGGAFVRGVAKVGGKLKKGRGGAADIVADAFKPFPIMATKSSIAKMDEFRSALAEFSNVSGLVGEKFTSFKSLAEKIAEDTGQTGAKMVRAFSQFIKINPDLLKDTEGLEKRTLAAIKLGEATGTSTAIAAKSIAETFQQLQIGSRQAAIISKKLSTDNRLGDQVFIPPQPKSNEMNLDNKIPNIATRALERQVKFNPITGEGELGRPPITLSQRLDDVIDRLDGGDRLGATDNRAIKTALSRLQDIREQSAKLNSRIGDKDIERTDLQFDSPRNSQGIFRITTAMDTLEIRKNNLAKEAQAIKSQLQEINELRQEIDNEGNVFDTFSKASGGVNELKKAQNDLNTTTLKTVETISFQREAMNGLLTPLTGLTEDTGSLTAEIKKNSSAFDENEAALNRVGNAAKKTKTSFDRLIDSSDQFGNILGKAFEDAVVNGKDLRSVLRGLEKDLLRQALKTFGVTGKGGIFSTIFKDIANKIKGVGLDSGKPTVSFKDVGVAKVVDQLPAGAGSFDVLGDSVAQLTARFGMASAGADLVSNALQTSAVDTLTAAAKTTFLAAAEDTAASSIFELAVAARVASSALNSVGASKGGGLGGLGGLFGGGEDFSLPFDSATDIAFGGPGFLDFAHGGRFTVRGPAGIDNLLTPLRLTAGERVTVETPAQQKANGQGTTIINNITMNITTPDSGGFRKSQNQIVADLQRALNRAQRIQ